MPTAAVGYLDPSFFRQARRAYRCAGSGGRPVRHAPECPLMIQAGDRYLEYVGGVAAFQSGHRVTMACAERFFRDE